MKDNLIEKLSADLKPVRVRSLSALAGQYALIWWGFAFVALVWLRPDAAISERILHFDFWLALFVFGGATLYGASLVARYSRPGSMPHPSKLRFWGSATLVLAAGAQGYLYFLGSPRGEHWGPAFAGGWECAVAVLGVTLAASVATVGVLRHQAPVKLLVTMRVLLLSGGAMAAFVLQIHCPNANPLHLLTWHILLPACALWGLARVVSGAVLRW